MYTIQRIQRAFRSAIAKNSCDMTITDSIRTAKENFLNQKEKDLQGIIDRRFIKPNHSIDVLYDCWDVVIQEDRNIEQLWEHPILCTENPILTISPQVRRALRLGVDKICKEYGK